MCAWLEPGVVHQASHASHLFLQVLVFRLASLLCEWCIPPPQRWLHCRYPRHVAACEPGTAANCHPTQVMYPIPQQWMQQLQVQGHVATGTPAAAGSVAATCAAGDDQDTVGVAHGIACAADGLGSTSSCQIGKGKVLQSISSSSAVALQTTRVDHDLLLASFVADKHPVTWKGIKDVVWCEVGI